MREQIEQVLAELVELFGPEIFKSPNRFRGAILDHHIVENQRKIRFLLNLAICEMKVYTRLLSVNIDNLVDEMHEEYEINKRAAIEVIGCIAALHSLKIDRREHLPEKKEIKPDKKIHLSGEGQYVDEILMNKVDVHSDTVIETQHPSPQKKQLQDAHTPSKDTKRPSNREIKKKTVVDTSHKVGDTILFGQYKWRILEINDDGTALIISQDILTKMAYHNRRTNITWEKSDIRKYLNTNFYDKFDSTQQRAIITTEVQNPFNEKYFTQGGVPTIDKIFLLSIQQAKAYFKGDLDRVARLKLDKDWWWLRSPGRYPDHSAFIYRGGNVSMDGEVSVTTYMNRAGMRFVNYKVGGVRPAMVVALDKI